MNKEEKYKWYEKEFNSISEELKDRDSLSYVDFLRIRNFKLNNLSPETEAKIKKVTKEAFSHAKLDTSEEIEEAISILTKNLEGVRIPIASTILAMKFPDKYCIIDKRVLKQLGKDEWLKDYLTKPKVYSEYVQIMRKNAIKEGLSLRDYERSLFEKDFRLSLSRRKDLEEE
jgi:hypothetical protein